MFKTHTENYAGLRTKLPGALGNSPVRVGKPLSAVTKNGLSFRFGLLSDGTYILYITDDGIAPFVLHDTEDPCLTLPWPVPQYITDHHLGSGVFSRIPANLFTQFLIDCGGFAPCS